MPRFEGSNFIYWTGLIHPNSRQHIISGGRLRKGENRGQGSGEWQFKIAKSSGRLISSARLAEGDGQGQKVTA